MAKLLEKQGWHALVLGILLTGVSGAARSSAVQAGDLWGLPTSFWLWLAVVIPIAHQIYAVVAWRGQLHHQLLTHRFGDNAFLFWLVTFFAFLTGRPIAIILLAIANAEQMTLAWPWRIVLTAVFLPIFAYTMYSVMYYFGAERAAGADHFDPQAYREKPFVKEGMFKYTENAMYKFAFLGNYIPGILAASPAALLVALFSHLYIWVHFYTVEKPDMRHIYGE